MSRYPFLGQADMPTGETLLNELIAKQDPAKLQDLMRTMAAATRESQALMSEMMNTGALPPTAGRPDPFKVGESYMRLGQSLAAHPQRLAAANMQLWQGYMEIWSDLATGQIAKPTRDRRFGDPEWQLNPVFDAMRRTYELNTKWLMGLIDSADDMEPEHQRKAHFFAQQTADAFSPTNFFATNPAALRAMIKTGGQSVLDGLRQARKDLKRGKGKLTISQTDETPFRVGKNVATAPGRVVYKNDLMELIQYAPTTETVHKRPLLIFPPWINKFYILDLREENSMIRYLVDQGLTVFVVSWRSADETTKSYTWDDYIEKGGYAALEAALDAARVKNINAVGYCIGGTMLSGLLAHMALQEDERIQSATYFASQSDFELAGDLLVFTDEEAIAHTDTVIEENGGLMPGEVMRETFNWLRPVDLVWRYIVDNYMMGKKPRPFDLLYWNSDQTNIPGPTHKTYLSDLYHQNKLARGEFQVLGETVDLSDIKIPVLVQASRDDHICPYQSVYRTAQSFGGPSTFVLAGSGHIAGVVNHPDAKKYQHWVNSDLPDKPSDWLAGAEEIPGSWWPYWMAWLKKRSGKQVEARNPKKKKGMSKAPGKYVKKRLEQIAAERGL